MTKAEKESVDDIVKVIIIILAHCRRQIERPVDRHFVEPTYFS